MLKRRPEMPVVPMTLSEMEVARRAERDRMDRLLAYATIELDQANALRRRGQEHRHAQRWWFNLLAAGHEKRGKRALGEVIRIRKAIRSGDDVGLHRRTRRATFRQEGR
mgnify:CR=1 FL=1